MEKVARELGRERGGVDCEQSFIFLSDSRARAILGWSA